MVTRQIQLNGPHSWADKSAYTHNYLSLMIYSTVEIQTIYGRVTGLCTSMDVFGQPNEVVCWGTTYVRNTFGSFDPK